MNRRTPLFLLALLVVVFAATGVGATSPSDTAIEPAAPAATGELTPLPVCTEDTHAAASMAEVELAPSPVELADLVVETGWHYGICVPNRCQPCTSNADCTDGNTCAFGVQCP